MRDSPGSHRMKTRNIGPWNYESLSIGYGGRISDGPGFPKRHDPLDIR